MAIIRDKKEIELLKEGGKRLASILRRVADIAKEGVSTAELDILARKLIDEGGDEPSFLDYEPHGAKRPYPSALCVSINEEIVHGLPSERRLKEGDLVGLDLGLKHSGLFLDSAVTVGVGNIDKEGERLISTCTKALQAGVAVSRAGLRTGDIGYAIQEVIKLSGFGIVRDLAGHGVGRAVHEEPFVPNYGKKGEGVLLEEGMVLALEPMITEGRPAIKLLSDDFTYVTKDGSRSVHFEHTILITRGGAEVVTS